MTTPGRRAMPGRRLTLGHPATPSRSAAARRMDTVRQLSARRPAEPRRAGLGRLSGLTIQGWFGLVFAVLAVLAVVAAVVVANKDFTAGLAGFLVAAVLLALVVRRTVVRPLRRLREDSRRVIGGEFSHRIEVTGPADLRAVAADVEAMRSGLVDALRQADAQATELLRSNAELEQFAYVASHDLQEPLRKVASFCQLLERRYGDQLDERGHQYIDFAVDGAKRLQTLINDLLTFSRVGRDEVRVRLPLDQPLDVAIRALAAAIEESGAVIERPERLPEIMGDATLLAMLWQNLLGNGIKFRSSVRSPVLRITAAELPVGMWKFCVEDNGIGIAPEFAEKIFVIFQRLHSRDAYPGTGIGLALCKRIVESHGGEISLDLARTEGARICFTLPMIDPVGLDQAELDDSDQAAAMPTGGHPPSAQPSETSSPSAASTEGIPAR
ncbi:MAG TPA: ATP-binding protein [Streptosporangiaceae bacterium]|nr:ATP-binding protein [Streptosporangiaceae bacterium]